MTRTITPRDLQARLAGGHPLTLLDVRRRADYEADRTRIPGAEWHDPEAIDAWADSLPRDREVVLYCVRGGSVSNAVLDRLLAMGVRARYVEDGLEAWKQTAGLPPSQEGQRREDHP